MNSLHAEAWCHLIRFEVVLLFQRFATLYNKVRNHPVDTHPSYPRDVEEIVAAFESACVWYPKQVRCLQRSAALTCLLRDNGIPARMVIGTQKRPFKAHAWVEVNGRVANDKDYTAEMYAVLDRC